MTEISRMAPRKSIRSSGVDQFSSAGLGSRRKYPTSMVLSKQNMAWPQKILACFDQRGHTLGETMSVTISSQPTEKQLPLWARY